jgi:CBS domain-containing protein
MLVRDIMTKTIQGVRSDATLADAAKQMTTSDIGLLPVMDSNLKVLGVVTDRDIVVKGIAKDLSVRDSKVGDIMTKPITYCLEDEDVESAANNMRERQVRRMIVLNSSQEPVGVVSLGDLSHPPVNAETVRSVVRDVSTPQPGTGKESPK